MCSVLRTQVHTYHNAYTQRIYKVFLCICTSKHQIHIMVKYDSWYYRKSPNFPCCKEVVKKLSHFKSLFYFLTPWKRQKTSDFLTYSEGTEMEHWLEMGYCNRLGLAWVLLVRQTRWKQNSWRIALLVRKCFLKT